MRGIRLCMALTGLGISEREQIRLMKMAGFDGFFSEWRPGCDMDGLRAAADEEGMLWQSVHAPFTKMAAMWTECSQTEEAVGELIDCARDCARCGVDLMIVHPFIGFEEHSPSGQGLIQYGRVVSEAKRLGVRIAFENVEGEEYLFALMEHFAGEKHVGFCWDTGHQMCYNPGTDMMALYGDRLFGTHINDNLGVKDSGGEITWVDDLHLLPFDGIADWQEVAVKIKTSGFQGPLTFELGIHSKPGRHENDGYGRMSPEEYMAQAYIRACRVAALVLRA